MLNWDEYNNDDAQVAPAIKNTTPKEVSEAPKIEKKEPEKNC